MAKENVSFDVRLKNVNETKKYFIEEIMSKWVKSIKCLQGFELHWEFSYFCFCCQWLCLKFMHLFY